MKALLIAPLSTALAISSAQAKPKPSDSQPQELLRDAARQMVTSGNDVPPGQVKRPDDPDMGDDNASDRALLVVCTKDTPAAERSAICDRFPVSPD